MGCLVRLHDVLRDAGQRGRLDRAEGLPRARRRRRVQEGAGRGGPVPLRVLQPRDRAGAGGPPRLLAEGPGGEAARLPSPPPHLPPAWPPSPRPTRRLATPPPAAPGGGSAASAAPPQT